MVSFIGILNITPDSFSDGGKFLDPVVALTQARKLFADGAGIVDIGSQATNPFVEPISADEEWARLKSILPILNKEFHGRLSLDTFHPEVAEKALRLGPFIINDVTTFRNPSLVEVAARHKATCIVSHLPLQASSIKDAHDNFRMDSAKEVKQELLQQRQIILNAGVSSSDIWLDPGVGFGKTMRLNWELLRFASLLPNNQTVVIGHSKKRFLATDTKTGELLTDANKLKVSKDRNLEAAMIAVQASKNHQLYLRVHDVSWYEDLLQ